MAGIVIARHGKVAHFSAIGFADIEYRLPMARDTIFRTYSMTKQITSVALMMLFKEGRFPSFKSPAPSPIALLVS